MRGIELRNVQKKTSEELLVLASLIQDGAATLDFLLRCNQRVKQLKEILIGYLFRIIFFLNGSPVIKWE